MYCTSAPSPHCLIPSWTIPSRSLGCAAAPNPQSALQKLGLFPSPASDAIVSESACGFDESLSSMPTAAVWPELLARYASTFCFAVEPTGAPASLAGAVPASTDTALPNVYVSHALSHGAFAKTSPPP